MKLITKILYGFSRLAREKGADLLVADLEKKVGIEASGRASQSPVKMVPYLLRALKPRAVMISDVRANQGRYTSEILEHLGHRADFKIHAIEPSPKTYGTCRAVRRSNQQVYFNNIGLAELHCKATPFMNSRGSGLAALSRRKPQYFGIDHGKVEKHVELETLENYAMPRNISRISPLEIDVARHELDVVNGAASCFKEGKMDMVQFELGGSNIDTQTFLLDFFLFFKAHGFELFRPLVNFKLLLLGQYWEQDEKFRSCNHLAASPSLGLTRKFTLMVV
jgi:FkbM family methyltransferase